MDVEVALINNGIVDANEDDEHIVLKTDPKSGSGTWRASAGELDVNVAVSGSAGWEATGGGRMVVDTACTGLTGSPSMTSGGILNVNAAFESTGSISGSGSTSAINATASFQWGN